MTSQDKGKAKVQPSDRGRGRGRGGRVLRPGTLTIDADRQRHRLSQRPPISRPTSSQSVPSETLSSQPPASQSDGGIRMIPTPPHFVPPSWQMGSVHPSHRIPQEGGGTSTSTQEPPHEEEEHHAGDEEEQAHREEREFVEEMEQMEQPDRCGPCHPRVQGIPRSLWEVQPSSGKYALVVSGKT